MVDAILLDCDGVITDRHARVDSRTVFEAYRLAHAGKRIAFVTGRSTDWLIHNVVPAVEHYKPSPDERGRFFFVGECGNRWITFSSNGISHGSDDSHSLPKRVREEIRQEIWRFPNIFFDETKESFVSLEAEHEKRRTAEGEREAQKQLDEAFEFFSSKHPDFSVHRTLYAVDVVARGVGKASGARRALELMGGARHALIIGDSPIDLEMGEELLRQGARFEFYNVGEKSLKGSGFTVKKAGGGLFSEGTLEILRCVR